MSTNNGATPPPPPSERPRDVRTRTITFSLGEDVVAALYAMPNRSRWLDALLREQPAIREWLAQHNQPPVREETPQ